MEKDRGFKVMAVIALVIAVTGLSVAYAAYTETLTINGSAAVNKAQWDVKFANLTQDATVVGGGVSTTAPTLSDTTISGFKATLKAPGDSVSYKFDVTNAGTINAKLGTFTKGAISCSGSDSAGAEAICKELEYTLKYTGGDAVKETDTLTANETKHLTLTVAWTNGTAEATSEVTVTLPEITMIYNQD